MKYKHDLVAAERLAAANPDPDKWGVSFRRGEPILVSRSILRWRKARKKKAAKARRLEAVKAKHEQRANEALGRLKDMIINPFAAAPDKD